MELKIKVKDCEHCPFFAFVNYNSECGLLRDIKKKHKLKHNVSETIGENCPLKDNQVIVVVDQETI
jgi:hypothetical protein